ncbi:MAG: ATP-grasp domain-containing protein [Myxococcota bacterium]
MRVLVLDAGVTSAYHVLRSVARAGHEAHLSSSEESPWFSSRYCTKGYVAPPYDQPGPFVLFLVDLLERGRFDLVVPCGDLEAEILDDHRADLPDGVRCFLPRPQAREIAFRKNAAYRHAERMAIRIPRTRYPSSLAQVRSMVSELSHPVVVKGQIGTAGSHVRFAAIPEETEEAWQEIADMEGSFDGHPSIQEYVPGPGYVVHCVFEHGRPVGVCCHRKDRQYPVAGGVTSAGTTVDEPELEDAACAFLRSLRWHGVAKMDFIRDRRDGRFRFIEVDPRVSASIDITRVAGADQIAMLCDLAEGRSLGPRRSYRPGVRYRWLWPRDVLQALLRPHTLPLFAAEFLRPKTFCDLGFEEPELLWRLARSTAWHARHDLTVAAIKAQIRRVRRLRVLVARATAGGPETTRMSHSTTRRLE